MKKKKLIPLSSIVLSASLIVSPFASATDISVADGDSLDMIIAAKGGKGHGNGSGKSNGNTSNGKGNNDASEEELTVTEEDQEDVVDEEIEDLEEETEEDENLEESEEETEEDENLEESEEETEEETEDDSEEDTDEDEEESEESGSKKEKKKGLFRAFENVKGTPAESVIQSLIEEKYGLDDITSVVNELADDELTEEAAAEEDTDAVEEVTETDEEDTTEVDEESDGTEVEETSEELEVKKEKYKAFAKELRKQYKDQEKEIKKSLKEAKKESPERYEEELGKLKTMLENLATLHEKSDDVEGALELQTEAVETDLMDLNSYKKLAKLYEQANNYNGIKAFVNGKHPKFELPPVIKNKRTLVPFRAISESLNAEVEWNGEENAVYVSRDGVEVKLIIGESVAYVNGEEVELDVPAEIMNRRTFVPVRFISEAFDAYVDWEGETGSVIIVDENINDDEDTVEEENDQTSTDEESTEETNVETGTEATEQEGSTEESGTEATETEGSETDESDVTTEESETSTTEEPTLSDENNITEEN